MHILLLNTPPLHGQKRQKGQKLPKLTIRKLLLQDYSVLYFTITLNKY